MPLIQPTYYILITKIIEINFLNNIKEVIKKVAPHVTLSDPEWEMYVTTKGQNMAHLI